MAQLLVRDLDDQVMTRLKERARRNRRSLQAEALEVFRGWHEKFRGRPLSDSTDLIREDRDR